MITRNEDRDFIIKESLVVALMNYLSHRPFIEVCLLIDRLNKITPIVEEKKDADNLRP